jgi:hypothetical protein
MIGLNLFLFIDNSEIVLDFIILIICSFSYKMNTEIKIKILFLTNIVNLVSHSITYFLLIYLLNNRILVSNLYRENFLLLFQLIMCRYLSLTILNYILYKKSKITDLNIKIFKYISFIVSVFYGITVILMFNEKLFYHLAVGRIFVFTLIFYNIVLVIFNFYQNAHIRTVNDLENLRNNINYQSKHLDDIFESQQEIRRIKHDMLREYGGFYGYLESGDYDKLKDCLHSKMEELKTMEKVTFFEEPYIDYAISQKIAYAKNRGIEIKIETKTVSIGNIKPADLSLLIINALDNAIEATEKLEIENKIITFSFHTANNTLLMSFINNVKDKNIDFSKSSKLVDKKNHGFGVSSIKHIVDMYGGYCKYERHDDKISLNVMLPID